MQRRARPTASNGRMVLLKIATPHRNRRYTMRSPLKIQPVQKLIRNFMKPMSPTLRSTATADANPTTHGQDQHLNVTGETGDDQHQSDSNISPDESVPCRRRRRVITDDDDEPIQTVPVNPTPLERILVTDTADESDANFAVILLPTSRQVPAANHATQPPVYSNTTPRRSERVATKSQEEVRSKKLHICSIVSVQILFAQAPHSHHDSNIEYEGEAEESDMDDSFIDDADPDESDDEAKEMTRETCESMRNRRKWKETEFECPLCADLRVVLKHLLRRE
jgi:hypothetical protein